MIRSIHIRTYSPGTIQIIRQSLVEAFEGVWLEDHVDKVFHICDELVKNGIKSNYKTILYWIEARRHLMSQSEVTQREADDWLYEVFYSGENALIDRQYRRVDKAQILKDLLDILEMEAAYIDHRTGRKRLTSLDSLRTLLRIKRFCKQYGIGVQIRIEHVGDRFNITVTNDAPILDEDLKRIQNIRRRFREHQKSGTEDRFFLEHMDTSGGGHGLGYPLIDSLLSSMNLDPDLSLFLISATRTMILLTIPDREPKSYVLLPAP